MLKHFSSFAVRGTSLGDPFEKLSDLADLQTKFLETFDQMDLFNLPFSKSSDICPTVYMKNILINIIKIEF